MSTKKELEQLFSEIGNIAIFASDENRVVCEWKHY